MIQDRRIDERAAREASGGAPDARLNQTSGPGSNLPSGDKNGNGVTNREERWEAIRGTDGAPGDSTPVVSPGPTDIAPEFAADAKATRDQR